jgi:XTP/dITP diphosphohydrolase
MRLTVGRLVLLQTSPRVPAGLLTASAWDALRSADVVLAPEPDGEQARAVTAAGVRVDAAEPDLATVLDEVAAGRSVVWLCPDGDPDDDPADLTDAVAAEVVRRSERGEPPLDVEVLAGSYDMPGARLLDLVEVMDRLRTSCPWDRDQTHRSLARYLVEEAYETVEAIDTGDREHLREELGDLLLQVLFHGRIAAEHPDDPWNVDDVAAGIVEKLVRRHPHVFAGLDVAGADEVEANWETIKAAEKQRASVLEGIPLAMPALGLAEKVLGRAERIGSVPDEPSEDPGPEEEIGARLLHLVAEARHHGVDPEQALRDAVRRLSASVAAAERR